MGSKQVILTETEVEILLDAIFFVASHWGGTESELAGHYELADKLKTAPDILDRAIQNNTNDKLYEKAIDAIKEVLLDTSVHPEDAYANAEGLLAEIHRLCITLGFDL